ncbi:DegT/DnrJ/EryC1/StrS family aminotransferase [Streptomyces sp. LP05-1]|uniref:DegT/DnrJ/EryC1/StrS family aminotransferase n=1 Tax=Streptomyces pyxinae TaxID=2970734 RepID=A0ABT2CHQ5_9ACTN|nr:DegT/DnrJ/EryC1/StrS family aminotransferase [Streptomyces sp. LP05-1]MCS0636935.1 DegT/DnrJ/EryC1/StrS family aminotransferase [Streptomyces sp. LP05-1]
MSTGRTEGATSAGGAMSTEDATSAEGALSVAEAVAELPRRFGQPAAEFTASGSAALEVALELLEIGPGDEVVVPDVGCHSVAAAVVRVGAVPVFTGVGEALTLEPEHVAAACGSRTRAVIAVHQYGLPCDVPGIVAAVAPEVTVIEDVAQTWGSSVRGVPAGATGALAVTSFGPSKPVALGAGGALLGPASAVTGTVAHGDGGDRHLPRAPSPARFPAPLLELLPGAVARADRRLRQRAEAVARFTRDELAAHFRLPPMPPDSTAGWTRMPLYPLDPLDTPDPLHPLDPVRPAEPAEPATDARVARIEAVFGPVQRMHPLPPSALPMFRRSAIRVVPGGHRPTQPLLVRIGRQPR